MSSASPSKSTTGVMSICYTEQDLGGAVGSRTPRLL